MDYAELINGKTRAAPGCGFRVDLEGTPLFPFQRAATEWALSVGRAALFEDTGLGKTIQQLVWAREVDRYTGLPVLLLAPLAVTEQTRREAARFGIGGVSVVTSASDIDGPGVYVTNYEKLHHFDDVEFGGVVLDESSILKNYTGATKRQLVERFADTPYRLCCSATPAPNDYMELGNHSEFLGVMDSHKMLARFFMTDQSTFGSYRLKGHAIGPFWDWVCSWARCVGVPSDIGDYDDTPYQLPPLQIVRELVSVDIVEGRDEGQLFRVPELSATAIHKEKRRTSMDRAQRVADLVRAEPGEAWVVWCETNYDADSLREVLPDAVEVRGSTEDKAALLLSFTDRGGVIITKPGIAGMGLNWQHCARQAFVGVSFSYERFYQAVRRSYRFGQSRPVRVHVIMAPTEAATWSIVSAKGEQHERMKAEMFAASRRAQARTLNQDPYHPTHSATLPSWLRTTP